MSRLLGKNVGDTVVEVFGPFAGKSFFSDGTYSVIVAPTVQIQVFGSGTVEFQENVFHTFVGERASNIGGQSAINLDIIAAPDIPAGIVPPSPPVINWVPVGAVINQASGLQTRSVAIGGPDPTFLRLIVTVAGTGRVHFETKWS